MTRSSRATRSKLLARVRVPFLGAGEGCVARCTEGEAEPPQNANRSSTLRPVRVQNSDTVIWPTNDSSASALMPRMLRRPGVRVERGEASFFVQRRCHVVDSKGMNLATFTRRTARKPRSTGARGIVRMHGKDAALAYARGDAARGELIIESGELKWRSGCCGSPAAIPR